MVLREQWRLGPGTYRLRLRLAETRAPRDPKRKPMDVRVNGREVISGLDIAGRAGGFFRALDLDVAEIRPQNGVIEVRFIAAPGGEATVQAMEIIPCP